VLDPFLAFYSQIENMQSNITILLIQEMFYNLSFPPTQAIHKIDLFCDYIVVK
jgi:hypothetical protein